MGGSSKCSQLRKRCRSTARGSTTCSTSLQRESSISGASSKRPSMRLAISAIPTLSDVDIGLRLVLAAALGGAIGVEREIRDREAGIRTHLLVALGSCLFTIISAYGFHLLLSSGEAVARVQSERLAEPSADRVR